MLAVDCNEFIHALDRRQSHRSRNLSHLCIGAKGLYQVLGAESKIAHQAELFREIIAVGNDSPAFEAVKKFGRMKAEDRGVPVSSNGPLMVSAPKCVRGIVDDPQIVTLCY